MADLDRLKGVLELQGLVACHVDLTRVLRVVDVSQQLHNYTGQRLCIEEQKKKRKGFLLHGWMTALDARIKPLFAYNDNFSLQCLSPAKKDVSTFCYVTISVLRSYAFVFNVKIPFEQAKHGSCNLI